MRDNQWHYIAVTFDGSSAKAFVDGTLENSKSFSTTFNSSSGQPFIIGYINHSSGSNEYFPGLADEVHIWNEALTAAEITALYNSGVALDARNNAGDYSSTTNLVGYWKMEDGSGTKLTDVSGNGNDGTINGATWTTGVLSTSYDNTPK